MLSHVWTFLLLGTSSTAYPPNQMEETTTVSDRLPTPMYIPLFTARDPWTVTARDPLIFVVKNQWTKY